MTDRGIEQPSQRTVPAAVAPSPVAFPASVFNLAGAGPAAAREAPAEKKTRVPRGLDYVREHGCATNDEIAKAMGLSAGSHPGSYLAVAVKDGRLETREGRWHLGPGRRSAVLPPTSQSNQDPPEATEQERLEQIPAMSDPAPASIQIFPTDVAVVARVDGSILIAVDGQAVDLTPKQARLMQAFSAMLSHTGVEQ
ncbi:hypothetical protein [Cupriavidus sp. SS-3]|uniref:hypothetical protein n=1 Tax=Cupriavidus sp. SS-3 TaxID=3109596 RepID=UPI002DB770C0|nr:hypothetical protein [Cupriavidus sp. SS-3]MEC3764982.1 hypothetical protein [Cupriavidus sp. SS-3]